MTSAAPFSGGAPIATYTATAIGAEATAYTVSGAAKRVVVTGLAIAVSAACSVQFLDGTGGAIKIQVPLLAINTPFVLDLGEGIVLTAGNNLRVISSAAANLSGMVFGRET